MSVRDRLAIEPIAYGRPLQSILESRRRIALALVDRRRARLCECSFGRIRSLEEIEHAVPARSRAGGSSGYDEGRLGRLESELHHAHYRDVAERLFAHWRREKFDHVIVAGSKEDASAFEGHLHPFLQDRLAGRIAADWGSTRLDLERDVEAIERDVVRRDMDSRLAKLYEQAGRGGLGVLGLGGTINALARGQVHSLFVRDGFEVPGQVCLDCRSLGVEERVCPRCEREMTAVSDVIDDAVEEAIRQRSTVYTVDGGRDDFSRAGSIGALLRFRD
jgi:peptide chain release factor subunit 1